MADKAPDQEPSIEEILASIRQIISDDDEKPAAVKPAAAPTPAPEPEPEEDDVLELDQPLDAPEEEEEEEIEVALKDNDPPPVHRVVEEEDEEDILSAATRAATMASLAKLTGHTPINRTRGYDGVTLEDIVREMLHPMLREWMDANLPKMVERLVQKELEKLARRVD